MKIIIEQVQGVLISSLLIIGLTACSSSPSPWSQTDDSPWKSKREADAANIETDEFIAVPLEEEPMMDEPVPVYEETIVVVEPEPMPEPEPEPMVEEPVATGIMSMPASGYAVQVFAGKSEDSVARYQAAHGLDALMTVKTRRDGEMFYVLVGTYDNRAAADQAADELQQQTGSKPWVRSIAGLQQIAAE